MEVTYHIRPYFVGIFPYIGLPYIGLIYGRYLKWPIDNCTMWSLTLAPPEDCYGYAQMCIVQVFKAILRK